MTHAQFHVLLELWQLLKHTQEPTLLLIVHTEPLVHRVELVSKLTHICMQYTR